MKGIYIFYPKNQGLSKEELKLRNQYIRNGNEFLNEPYY